MSLLGNGKRMVTVTINKNQYLAEEGEIFLLTANRLGIDIPHLCYEKALEPYGACRLCMVDVVTCGKTDMTPACTIRVQNGLEILTDTPQIIKHRNLLFELYLAEAPKSEVIKEMAAKYGVTKTRFLKKIVHDDPLQGKCILCGLCVRVCEEIMGASAISFINRGPYTVINTPFYEHNPDCEGCAACAKVCPTNAIVFEDIGTNRVMQSWSDTTVPLMICPECGKPFAPQRLMEKVLTKPESGLIEEIKDLCPECRRKYFTLREIRKIPTNGGQA
ncbi:2Fe-2S iron-sulfur cluster-binding protein [Methanospirillum stamsii]|uniref:Ferredoxin n=1 Tax=Methanospirillum stamsii TaxID=1277351 RepID=A0A2V2NIR7_9EURY|nr:2Fe-2S iron-sulfur cluster-binding protein [Methanospirillum stamsii]PWR76327.1 ferredoxin [Methanospirillum stamsii]